MSENQNQDKVLRVKLHNKRVYSEPIEGVDAINFVIQQLHPVGAELSDEMKACYDKIDIKMGRIITYKVIPLTIETFIAMHASLERHIEKGFTFGIGTDIANLEN